MPQEILPLREREGPKGIDPDESLEASLDLTSETPAEDIAGLFVIDRLNFSAYHRRLGTISLPSHPTVALPPIMG
jgi:hypothetical protein